MVLQQQQITIHTALNASIEIHSLSTLGDHTLSFMVTLLFKENQTAFKRSSRRCFQAGDCGENYLVTSIFPIATAHSLQKFFKLIFVSSEWLTKVYLLTRRAAAYWHRQLICRYRVFGHNQKSGYSWENANLLVENGKTKREKERAQSIEKV